jgi:hypothetical protein
VKDGKGRSYYKVYSGDKRPIDIRVRRKHIIYRPDVVWEYDGKRVIFEVAFQEDERQIVGEVTLAAIGGNCAKIIIIIGCHHFHSLYIVVIQLLYGYHIVQEGELVATPLGMELIPVLPSNNPIQIGRCVEDKSLSLEFLLKKS